MNNCKKLALSTALAASLAAMASPSFAGANDKATATNVAFADFTPIEYSTQGKPNVIVLTMDDLGYGQIPYDESSFDPKSMENREVVDTYRISVDKAIEAARNSTPTLRTLMDDGVRLTQGYVAHAMSGPSRAAIMTARSPSRYGVYGNTDSQDGIPTDELFLPELFQNFGYYTACVGKWHLSKITNIPVPEDQQTRDYHDNFVTYGDEPGQPQNRGFTYFMGFHPAGTAYYNSPALFENRTHIKAEGYISDQLTDAAIKAVDTAKATNQPFMLYLAYNAPHLPNDAPAPDVYQSKFNTGSPTADNFYAAIYSVDQGVKRLLERLEENGQLDNTMIFFTSDNGAVIDGPLPLNGNQAGYKSLTYPGGVHTPMFVYWKGHLESGSYDKLVSAMDFYPTALDAAGIPIPEDLKLDGVSLLPYLTGENKGNPHESLVWLTSFSHWFDTRNIPFWDNYHKYVRYESDYYPHNPNTENLSEFTYTVRTNDYQLIYTAEDNALRLYDLRDLQLKNDLTFDKPEVVEQLKQIARDRLAESKPPLMDINQPKYEKIVKALAE
ncbi:MAG TPA: sulfatase-like hydrolase/transferase [Candidatus Anaerobiospirillum pullistercoris]|uniref:Sulfatase-like hydrolase/transferase n=1 Tax=Candidatus Anaerobiospirillum pullistercoris TaxID=2838452 RepID=A0A9D2B0T9_9GAMM|nr:sulfatase-like hydrolase/transferase [Candidatus Anaerobiospirillum pullistercoris]